MSSFLHAFPFPNAYSSFSAVVGTELSYFKNESSFPGVNQWMPSLSAEPEWAWESEDGTQFMTLKLFGRWDREDDDRSHIDIREMSYVKVYGDFELRVGIDKVYWGVVESYHLVDIINQTDLVESLDFEEKLGQPILGMSWFTDHGTWDAYLLPLFRERTFRGESGRFRFDLPVGKAAYESDLQEAHVDYAVRWSTSIDVWDVGVSHFSGTSRDPIFQPVVESGELKLQPFYAQIQQTSLDIQAIMDGVLWKAEMIYRSRMGESYWAGIAGVEYTLVGLWNTAADLGIIAELLLDDRGDDASVPFEHDLFMGLRWSANDAESTEFLGGGIWDYTTGALLMTVEANRRFGDDVVVSLEGRAFIDMPSDDAFSAFANDDSLMLEIRKYF